MSTKQRYTLHAGERLKSRKIIEQLFKTGKSFNLFPFKIIYLAMDNRKQMAENRKQEYYYLQSGFTVSTKYFKKSVDRNRIKRLMKEAYRLQKNELTDWLKKINKKLFVFFIYTSNEISDYKFIYDKTGNAITRLIKLTDENGVTNS